MINMKKDVSSIYNPKIFNNPNISNISNKNKPSQSQNIKQQINQDIIIPKPIKLISFFLHPKNQKQTQGFFDSHN